VLKEENKRLTIDLERAEKRVDRLLTLLEDVRND
jgi:hypothetical protein